MHDQLYLMKLQLAAWKDQTDSHQLLSWSSAGLSGWKNQMHEDCRVCQLNVLYSINQNQSDYYMTYMQFRVHTNANMTQNDQTCTYLFVKTA